MSDPLPGLSFPAPGGSYASADDLYKILAEIDSAIESRQLTEGDDPQAISNPSADNPTTTPSGSTPKDSDSGS